MSIFLKFLFKLFSGKQRIVFVFVSPIKHLPVAFGSENILENKVRQLNQISQSSSAAYLPAEKNENNKNITPTMLWQTLHML